MSDWYEYGEYVFVFGTVLIGLIIGVLWFQSLDKEHSEYHDKMNAVCAPFFFVEQERAADHLTRVKCLSEQGEKKEILIKDDAK